MKIECVTDICFYLIQKNPPKKESSNDPEVWKVWFESTFDVEVAGVTVALDNEKLIKALVRRRQLICRMQEMMPHIEDFDIDDLESNLGECEIVPRWRQVLCRAATPESVYLSILKEDSIIADLSNETYTAASIFVTFQEQAQQQKVLDHLILPKLRQKMLEQKYIFDDVILQVVEPAEPSAIRWHDLHTSNCVRVVQVFFTTLMSFGLIVGGAFVIVNARKISPELAALAITCFNLITPTVVRLMTRLFESHPDESSASASVYVKITALRWTNTAIVTTFITPFTFSLQEGEGTGLLDWVYTMYTFDLFTGPVLQITDIWGNLCRHVFATRQNDQMKMNLKFKSGQLDIGERYTNMTRIFFFTLFYCSLFPAGFFFAAVIFAAAYWLDKFSILRSYRQGPKVGNKVSRMSNFFLLLCLGTYAVMTSLNFAQFPFDNACDSGISIDETYRGIWTITESQEEVTLSDSDAEHEFCSQNLLRKFSFPPVPSVILEDAYEWMNPSQETYAPIITWAMCAILLVIGATILIRTIFRAINTLFFRDFKVSKSLSSARFEDVEEINGYVPQVEVDGYIFPFLLCDVDQIDSEMIGWSDAYSTYDAHNIIYDVPKIAVAKCHVRKLQTDDTCVSDSFVDNGAVETVVNSGAPIFAIVKSWVKPMGQLRYGDNATNNKEAEISVEETSIEML